jgi:hypothetical protein
VIPALPPLVECPDITLPIPQLVVPEPPIIEIPPFDFDFDLDLSVDIPICELLETEGVITQTVTFPAFPVGITYIPGDETTATITIYTPVSGSHPETIVTGLTPTSTNVTTTMDIPGSKLQFVPNTTPISVVKSITKGSNTTFGRAYVSFPQTDCHVVPVPADGEDVPDGATWLTSILTSAAGIARLPLEYYTSVMDGKDVTVVNNEWHLELESIETSPDIVVSDVMLIEGDPVPNGWGILRNTTIEDVRLERFTLNLNGTLILNEGAYRRVRVLDENCNPIEITVLTGSTSLPVTLVSSAADENVITTDLVFWNPVHWVPNPIGVGNDNDHYKRPGLAVKFAKFYKPKPGDDDGVSNLFEVCSGASQDVPVNVNIPVPTYNWTVGDAIGNIASSSIDIPSVKGIPVTLPIPTYTPTTGEIVIPDISFTSDTIEVVTNVSGGSIEVDWSDEETTDIEVPVYKYELDCHDEKREVK